MERLFNRIYSKNKILKAKKSLLENGKMKIISYYENGNKEEEVFVINELFDGEAFKYYPSGKLRNKSFFKDGKREGESLTFINDKLEKEDLYYDEKGNLTKTEIYKNGVKQ